MKRISLNNQHETATPLYSTTKKKNVMKILKENVKKVQIKIVCSPLTIKHFNKTEIYQDISTKNLSISKESVKYSL